VETYCSSKMNISEQEAAIEVSCHNGQKFLVNKMNGHYRIMELTAGAGWQGFNAMTQQDLILSLEDDCAKALLNLQEMAQQLTAWGNQIRANQRAKIQLQQAANLAQEAMQPITGSCCLIPGPHSHAAEQTEGAAQEQPAKQTELDLTGEADGEPAFKQDSEIPTAHIAAAGGPIPHTAGSGGPSDHYIPGTQDIPGAEMPGYQSIPAESPFDEPAVEEPVSGGSPDAEDKELQDTMAAIRAAYADQGTDDTEMTEEQDDEVVASADITPEKEVQPSAGTGGN